jgi:hypothetical protein
VLCVPISDPGWNTLEGLDDLPDQLQHEIEHFFSVYKDLEQKKVSVDGWYSREDALEEIEAARKRCRESKSEESGAQPQHGEAKSADNGGESGAGGSDSGAGSSDTAVGEGDAEGGIRNP